MSTSFALLDVETIEIPKPSPPASLPPTRELETILIPPAQSAAQPPILVYETISIPEPQTVSPLPLARQLETIEIPPRTPAPPLPPTPEDETIEIPVPLPAPVTPTFWYERLWIKKYQDSPYFEWVALGPKSMALDYRIVRNAFWNPNRASDPSFSIVTEDNTVHIYGSRVLVNGYNSGGQIIGSIFLRTSFNRPPAEPKAFAGRWRWKPLSRGQYLMQFNKILIRIDTVERIIKIWHAEYIEVHELGCTHVFCTKAERPPIPLSEVLW